MTIDTYYCDRCGTPDYSSIGNSLYGWEDKLVNMSVCFECLKELREEKAEKEKEEQCQSE